MTRLSESLNPAKKYEEYLPEVFQGLLEIKELARVVNENLEDYYKCLNQFTDNRFVTSMDLETVKRWEFIFSSTSPIKDDLQSRRQAIQAKMMSQPPISIDTLKRMTEAYLGVPVLVESHVEPYVVRVTYRGIEKLPDMQPFYNSLYDTVPSNIKLIVEYAYQIWKSVKSKKWSSLSTKTWHEVHYDL